MMAEEILRVEGLSLDFLVAHSSMPALRDVSFAVKRGEVLGLAGESGSGKSTLLFAIMSSLPRNGRIVAGNVLLQDKEILRASRAELDSLRGHRLSMVYQDPSTSFTPTMTIGAQIVETIERHLPIQGEAARKVAIDWLHRVELPDPERTFRSYPHQLSGGMRQRAMIAMALCCGPDLLLLDEPTTGLDVLVQAGILELVRGLCKDLGLSAVFVSHDLRALEAVSDRIGILYAGELVEIGDVGAVLREPRHPYTAALLRSIPSLDDRVLPSAIGGRVNRQPDRFGACVFVDRCTFARDVCHISRPVPQTLGPQAARCHLAAEIHPTSGIDADDTGPDTQATNVGKEEVLSVKDLHVDYGISRRFSIKGGFSRSSFKAVRGVDFSIRRGELVAIVGESGSGKTSVTRAILGLVPISRGTVILNGTNIRAARGRQLRSLRRSTSIVFQNPSTALNPRRTVQEIVGRPLLLEGMSARDVREAVGSMLETVGLDESFLPRRPGDLSGGEKQRVALARSFLAKPDLLIFDEPTTALDVSVQASVLRLIYDLKNTLSCGYLLISHDLSVVRQLADRVLVMSKGQLCEAGEVEDIFQSPKHPYTLQLLEAARH